LKYRNDAEVGKLNYESTFITFKTK